MEFNCRGMLFEQPFLTIYGTTIDLQRKVGIGTKTKATERKSKNIMRI
jgi:hypothetical protein